MNEVEKLSKGFEDPLFQAIYDARSNMKTEDLMEITLVNENPIEWWILCQPESDSVYGEARKSLEQAINHTRQLLAKGSLTTEERTELTKFLKMFAALEGPVKLNDRIYRAAWLSKDTIASILSQVKSGIGSFVDSYIPWSGLLKNLMVSYPYQIYFTSMALIMLVTIILGLSHSSWPVFWTGFIPTVFTLIFTIGLLIKEEYGEIEDRYRFFAMLPITLLLWTAFFFGSMYGQLPIGERNKSRMVVSRGGDIQRLITSSDRIPRYPNLWETLVGGHNLVDASLNWQGEMKQSVNSLTGGEVVVNLSIIAKDNPKDLIGLNYSDLISERSNFYENLKLKLGQWGNSYNVESNTPLLSFF